MRKRVLDYAKPKRQRCRRLRWKDLAYLLIDSLDRFVEEVYPRSFWQASLCLLILLAAIVLVFAGT
jgi:hypothetical protein